MNSYHYPRLYEKIKKRVAERRFEPQGSTWVEADCNICSGESLVRQILLGKTFFMDEFGIDTRVLWLPDVFGYSAALPQILKKADVDYFSTIKISWSQFNRFPYSTFWWQGIDGSRVLAHFPPSNDYNARMDASQLRASAEAYREKDRSDIALYPFGWGDGGGGPDRTHLEGLKRARNLEGIPKYTPMHVGDFFEALSARSEDLPTWVGELYLEYHRGTYATQARNKRANRKSEFLLRDAEMLAGLAWALLAEKYPADELTRAWKLVCKNQFHDVIPGTSVADVYRDSAADYETVREIGEQIWQTGLDKLCGTPPGNNHITIFNSLSWNRSDAFRVSVPHAGNWGVKTSDGQPVVCQISADDPRSLWVAVEQVPAVGISSIQLVEDVESKTPPNIRVSEQVMENRFFRVKLDNLGRIESIYDKRANREVLPAGEQGNVFQLFEDKPLSWDAWDIEFYYRYKCEEITNLTDITVEEQGPIRGAIKIRRRFGCSEIEQRIVLWSTTPRIDFETRVDWHESKKMLKVAFLIAVHASSARFEIQFGSVERPNHWNTSWDFARFEVAAQKWADISQADYGVSLLNDSKYGYDVLGNVLRLTLLRSPQDPDPGADRGEHIFTYSLLPHIGDWRMGETIRRAYELNVPVVSHLTDDTPARTGCFLNVDVPNVVVETVKKAEREDALVIRMYECWGTDAHACVSTPIPLALVKECNLLEKDICSLPHENGKILLDFKPFEIKTLKLVPSR